MTEAWKRAVKEVVIRDGTVLIGSDFHFIPKQVRSTAFAALLRLVGELRPRAVIANGDVMNFAQISKHARIGWEAWPSVADELAVGQQRMGEIEALIDWPCDKVWTLGNHDKRFEEYLSANVPEYAGLPGFHLKDHFPHWRASWMVEINAGRGGVMVKHRWKGGNNAAFNNTVASGRTIVTGHLHSAKVSPFTDYDGTRWGVDTGCIAVPYDEQFIDYTEAGPVDWRSAVTVLTVRDYRLLPPEQLLVLDEGRRLTAFRGDLHTEES